MPKLPSGPDHAYPSDGDCCSQFLGSAFDIAGAATRLCRTSLRIKIDRVRFALFPVAHQKQAEQDGTRQELH